MVTSNLCLHKGARLIGIEELRTIPAPPPEGRWYPVPHYRVLETVKESRGDSSCARKLKSVPESFRRPTL
jgi:hypothetical protein